MSINLISMGSLHAVNNMQSLKSAAVTVKVTFHLSMKINAS